MNINEYKKIIHKHKYNARKTIVDNITFDSAKEARRYTQLKLLENAGKIKNLQLQVEFILQDKFKYKSKQIRAIKYIADFVYEEVSKVSDKSVQKSTETEQKCIQVVEDVKGYRTKEYMLKKKMFMYKYPDVDFREV